jgi:hypothetical protein
MEWILQVCSKNPPLFRRDMTENHHFWGSTCQDGDDLAGFWQKSTTFEVSYDRKPPLLG